MRDGKVVLKTAAGDRELLVDSIEFGAMAEFRVGPETLRLPPGELRVTATLTNAADSYGRMLAYLRRGVVENARHAGTRYAFDALLLWAEAHAAQAQNDFVTMVERQKQALAWSAAAAMAEPLAALWAFFDWAVEESR